MLDKKITEKGNLSANDYVQCMAMAMAQIEHNTPKYEKEVDSGVRVFATKKEVIAHLTKELPEEVK